MSDDYNKSWQAGLNGTGPTPTTNWDAYQAGKSIRDINQAELDRQNQAWSQPQPAQSFDAFSSAAPPAWTPPVYSGAATAGGGGGTGGSGGAAIQPSRVAVAIPLAFFLLLGGLALMPLLYPIAGIAALTVAAAGVLAAQLAKAADMTPVIILAALVVFWLLCRVEHRFAANAGYRWTRHVWRIFALAVFISAPPLKSILQQGPLRMADLAHAFTDWRNLIVIVVLAGIAHLVLRSKRLRKTWHVGLEGLRLRPRNLSAADSE